MLKQHLEEMESDFVEKGADIEHDRWARWQKYMFSKMIEEEKFEEGSHFKTGNYILPKEFVDRWFRQIDTKYADLSEAEKESDRKETRNYLPLLRTQTIALIEKIAEEVEGKIPKIQTWDKAFKRVPKYGEHIQSAGNGDLLKRGYNQALSDILALIRKEK